LVSERLQLPEGRVSHYQYPKHRQNRADRIKPGEQRRAAEDQHQDLVAGGTRDAEKPDDAPTSGRTHAASGNPKGWRDTGESGEHGYRRQLPSADWCHALEE